MLGIATPLRAFQFDVSKIYYSDAVRTINNYDFLTGTKFGDTITIPDSFVTKPVAESGLSYTFGLFDPTAIADVSLSWSAGLPCTLQTSADHPHKVAAIATTPTMPDTASAQTAWDYIAKLQNFVDVTDRGTLYEFTTGFGAPTGSNHPQILGDWLTSGNLQLIAQIKGSSHNSYLWQSSPVVLTGLSPSTTALELWLHNTGTAIDFYYKLNGGSFVLMGTYTLPQGTTIAGFPIRFPIVQPRENNQFWTFSSHNHDSAGNNYFLGAFVEDYNHENYSEISLAFTSSCGLTLSSTPLTYSSASDVAQWSLIPWAKLSSDVAPSCYPTVTYTAKRKDGGTDIITRKINNYVEVFATNIQPTGIVTGTPTFSWTGISGTTGATGYQVQLYDSQNNFVWIGAVDGVNQTSIVYSGPALISGMTYHYLLNSNVTIDGLISQSQVESTFTYLGADIGTRLYASFANAGIWQWGGSAWTQLTPDNPESIVAAGANLYGKFANGIWQWTGSGWTKLTPDRPASMVASGTNLYGNFTGNGIWKWGGSGWTQLTPDNPESMVAAGSNLYGKFGNGIWQWTGSGWNKLTPDRPADMVAAGSNLYGSFTGSGIWQWNGSGWTQLTADIPEAMAAAGSNLYGKFGNGIWQWNGSGWTKLTSDRPASMAAAGNILYGTFTGNGVWQWNGTNWTQLTPDNPAMMAVGE
jgi:hypothetical protein